MKITLEEKYNKLSYKIYSAAKHPDIYIAYENMVDYYLQNYEIVQAKEYFSKTLHIIEEFFPPKSCEIVRLRKKIATLDK